MTPLASLEPEQSQQSAAFVYLHVIINVIVMIALGERNLTTKSKAELIIFMNGWCGGIFF